MPEAPRERNAKRQEDVGVAEKAPHHEDGGEGALGFRPAGFENDVLHGPEDDEADAVEKERPLQGAGRR